MSNFLHERSVADRQERQADGGICSRCNEGNSSTRATRFQGGFDRSFAPHRPHVLVLNGDRLYANSWCLQVLATCPGAVCTVLTRVADARRVLLSTEFDAILTSIGAPDGDILDLLFSICLQRTSLWNNVLLVSEHNGFRLFASLRELGVGGLFDPESDGAENLPRAISAMLEKTHYWSDSIKYHHEHPTSEELRLRLLTTTEQLLFGTLGDGTDDEGAAELVGMTPSTVRTIRRNIYATLKVHEKWELIRAAERHGFVRFTHGLAATRIGFGLLLYAYQVKTQRPVPLTAPLVAAYPELAEFCNKRRQLSKYPQKLIHNIG